MEKGIFAFLLILAMAAPALYSVKNFGQKLSAASLLAKTNKQETSNSWLPVKKENAGAPELSSLSYLSAFIGNVGEVKILAEKNAYDQLPIASVTKLMTAMVAADSLDMEQIITMDSRNILKEEGSKRFNAGTKFKAKELLHAMLVESNNDAAAAFMEEVGKTKFIEQMNLKAKQLNLLSTYFNNPVGLDPKDIRDELNYSTAADLLAIAKEVKENYPQILEITSLPEYNVHNSDGWFNHVAVSTDKLLASNELACDGAPLKILGGKTGSTDLAKKNLVLITGSPNPEGYLINIVLSSDDNFEDTKKLARWMCESYQWR